ncbi:glycine receptor subunit alphaZ1-like [Saccoglossus kowalevskii]|uniref:Glycine receptor subunit alphaZ1-like n=1 Tax=Saccoglossus kowalevskii TaxID=10224 RepID=A0ABM0MZP9_SACKO|nr:PREDICTED: glycine receptor subunit alphaZ1-like [Saccoglossus kowalevskii]
MAASKSSVSDGIPDTINVSFYIASFHSISESDMDWSYTIYFRQRWNDPRLRHNASKPLTLDNSARDSLWVPDTYFMNAKKEQLHSTPKENSQYTVYGNGDVYYSIRMSLTSSCNMDLIRFPFDTQECRERVSSYAFANDDIVIAWAVVDPILMNEDVRTPQYYNPTWYLQEGNYEADTGNFSYIQMTFVLKRQLGFYMLQVYIPSTALVIIAWLTLWIDASVSSPARAALGITTVLALITQASWLRSEIPKVAYVTALDVWLVTCQLIVFLILLEFTFIYYLNKLSGRRTASGGSVHSRHMEFPTNQKVDTRVELSPSDEQASAVWQRNGTQYQCETSVNRRFPRKERLYYKLSQLTDKYCRVIFLGLFLLFNISYWLTYNWMPS